MLKYNAEKYITVLNNSTRVTTPFTQRNYCPAKVITWSNMFQTCMKEFHTEINGSTFKQTLKLKKLKILDICYFWFPRVFVSDNSVEFFKGIKWENCIQIGLKVNKLFILCVGLFQATLNPLKPRVRPNLLKMQTGNCIRNLRKTHQNRTWN